MGFNSTPGRFEPARDDLVGLARALAQDQIASREVLRSGVLRQVPLSSGEEGHHRVFADRLELDRAVLLDGHRNDADIELVAEDARDDVFGRVDGDGDLQVGVGPPEPGEDGRQEIGADRHRRSQARSSQPPFAVAAHRGERLLLLLGEPPRVRDQFLARRRRVRALAHALDEPHAEPLLELADLQAHGGLRQTQLVAPPPRSCPARRLRSGRGAGRG